MPKPKTPPTPDERPVSSTATTPPTVARPADWPATDATGVPPPAAPAAKPAQPSPPPPGAVPGTITAAAVLLFVMAILTGLFGTFMLLAGAFGPVAWMWDPMMGRPPFDQRGFDAAIGMAQFFMIGFAVILLAAATGHVIAGVGILRLRSWARVLGLVLAVFGLLVFGLSALGSVISFARPVPPGAILWLVPSAIFTGFYAFVVVVLGRRGDVFA